MTEPRRDLTLTVLAVLFLGGLIIASLWVLKPFLGALTWATMIAVATWPLMLRVEKAVGDRRWLAVTIMSVIQLLVLIVPLSAAIATIVETSTPSETGSRIWVTSRFPRRRRGSPACLS